MTTSTGPTWAQEPPNPTNLVRVGSYGYGARLSDVGRDGEIVATNRTRPTIRFSNGEQRNIGWGCLMFLDSDGKIVRDGNGNPLQR